MYVRNDSDRAWLIRVQMLPTDPDRYYVARVDPGADGPAVAWKGQADVPVEVLDSNCEVVGVFQTLDSTTYAVDGLTGLSGHVEPFNGLGANRAEGITDVDMCGGQLHP